jgi:hypothetical protein
LTLGIRFISGFISKTLLWQIQVTVQVINI